MNYNAGHLENIYDGIKQKTNNREKYIKQAKELDKIIENINIDIKVDLLEYRILSVQRTLEYINEKIIKNEYSELNTYITHCINKLNGNLDGLELTLEDKNEK